MDEKRVHFIGAGGVGINALAQLAICEGCKVSGSDAKLNGLTGKLAALGGTVWQGSDISRLGGVGVCVYSSAVREDDAELCFLRGVGAKIYERKEYLFEQSRQFARVAAIAGTHGKTTTTAMLTHIAYCEGMRFAALIGGESVDYGNFAYRVDGKEAEADFIVEACEYRRSFLSLAPFVGVALNAECDHPDCYLNELEVFEAFGQFLQNSKIKIVPKSLLHLVGKSGDGEDKDDEKDIVGEKAYAISDGQRKEYALRMIRGEEVLFAYGKEVGELQLIDSAPYNMQNALFAVAAADALGIPPENSLFRLKSFKGVRRRFERTGSVQGVPVYFDFAHHPTEIARLLDRAKKFGRALAVFQPHTFSRLKAYLDDFAKVFASIDSDVVLMPVYAARESADMGVSSLALRDVIFDKYFKSNVYLANSFEETLDFVNTLARYHDVVLFIGAGDVYEMRKYFKM